VSLRGAIVLVAFSKAPGAVSASRLIAWAVVHLCVALVVPAAAGAQVTGNVSIDSDYRLRGYSLSNGQPAISAELTYDDPIGAYVNLSALTKLAGSPKFLGLIGDVGYARRLDKLVTIDVGVLRSEIRAASFRSTSFDYTEFYAGAYVGPLTGRIYYSPDYRRANQSTLYGELEGELEPLAKWRIRGHLGLLKFLGNSTVYRAGYTDYDWQLSVSRMVGRIEIHAAVQKRGSDRYDRYRSSQKAVPSVGASTSF